MINSADNFKPRKKSLTEYRIRSVLDYVIICYKQIIKDEVKYSYSKIGRVKPEDYLRNRFVDDYLQKNICGLNVGTTSYSIINKESNEEYIGLLDSILHNDPIDIQIIDSALKDSWSDSSKIYFAIECKRITKISDGLKYISDTKKFSQRSYVQPRLPFEGQIAFVEHLAITPEKLSTYINSKLKNDKCLVTNDYLNLIELNNDFKGLYRSSHCKYGLDEVFTVYHLILDYSNIVE